MSITENEVLNKITRRINGSWIIRELDWFKRHPFQAVQWVIIILVAFFVLKFIWRGRTPTLELKNTDYKQVNVIRKSKFSKLFPGKQYPVPDNEIQKVIELEDGRTIIILKDDRSIVVSKDVEAQVTDYISDWGFALQPKLIGIVNDSGGDTGLGLKFFYVKDFGLNLCASSTGAGGGISIKPFKRFRNTSLEAGIQKNFNGGSTLYGGVGVEF